MFYGLVIVELYIYCLPPIPQAKWHDTKTSGCFLFLFFCKQLYIVPADQAFGHRFLSESVQTDGSCSVLLFLGFKNVDSSPGIFGLA